MSSVCGSFRRFGNALEAQVAVSTKSEAIERVLWQVDGEEPKFRRVKLGRHARAKMLLKIRAPTDFKDVMRDQARLPWSSPQV